MISATNQPLEELIEKGILRSDFFFRINVFPIHIDPLRERKEDIEILAMHFLNMFKRKYAKDIDGISREDLRKLTSYYWPGNVRELKHIIERAVILSESNLLSIPNLQDEKQIANYPSGIELSRNPPAMDTGMDEMERRHILRVLESCNGKVSGKDGAAGILKMNPQTLYSRIRRLGIEKRTVYQ